MMRSKPLNTFFESTSDQLGDFWREIAQEPTKWTIVFKSPREGVNILPPWYSDREWPGGSNPFTKTGRYATGDDEDAE